MGAKQGWAWRLSTFFGRHVYGWTGGGLFLAFDTELFYCFVELFIEVGLVFLNGWLSVGFCFGDEFVEVRFL